MNNNDIQTLFEKTRNKSIKIIQNLSPEDMNIQSMEDASPIKWHLAHTCLLYTSPSPRDVEESRMPSSA